MTEKEFEESIERYSEISVKVLKGKERIYSEAILREDEPNFIIDGHYYWMGKWGFRKVREDRGEEVVDFGSSVLWLSLVGMVKKVVAYDIRKPLIEDGEIEYRVGSLLGGRVRGVECLTSLHVIEHIGLGRYGDELDPLGSKKACQSIVRMVKKGGRAYVAMPVGVEKTLFNSHRVIDPGRVIEWFKGMELKELSGSHVYRGVPRDETNYIENVDIGELSKSHYACGMFHFEKT